MKVIFDISKLEEEEIIMVKDTLIDGKIYDVIEPVNNKLSVYLVEKTENGEKGIFPMNWFTDLNQYRNIKLKFIGI